MNHRNIVEKIQANAIKLNGHNPDDYLLDKRIGPATNHDQKKIEFLQEAAQWSPSRLEEVRYIGLYYNVYKDIMAAQALQNKDHKIPLSHFKIATYPGVIRDMFDTQHQEFEASSNVYLKSKHARRAEVRIDDVKYDIIWVDYGLMLTIEEISFFAARALIDNSDNFYDNIISLSDIGVQLFYQNLIEYPYVIGYIHQTIKGKIKYVHPRFVTQKVDDKLLEASGFITRSILTMIIGHECGHIILGHTRKHPAKVISNNIRNQLDERKSREFEADIIGFTFLVDSFNHSKTSIDYNWFGPTLYLAFYSTFMKIEHPNSKNIWQDKLNVFLEHMPSILTKVGFGNDRVARIVKGMIVTIGAVDEWLKHEYRTDIESEYLPEFSKYNELIRNPFIKSFLALL